VILFIATLNRIAEILQLQGDMESADVRRSTAIGILAQPVLAAQLLWDFRNQQSPAVAPQQADEPIHNVPDAPFDRSATPSANDQLDIAPEAESATDSKTDVSAGRGLLIQPPGVDLRKLRPQVVLHIHLSQEAMLSYHGDTSRFGGGVGRFESVGPITLGQVRRFLTDTGCDIKVQPVIDPHNTPAVDSYEIPRRIREAMFLRMPASCFPYATATGRLELDHTKPYIPPVRGGPPGQTGVHNLGPLIRFEHRTKTHGRWQVRQPEPGVWLWRSPHRALYLVTNVGTHNLGNGPFARRIWKATTPTRRRPVRAA